MSVLNLIFTYSLRLIKREWRLFVLPFLSLAITAVVLVLILFLTNSSEKFLDQQQKFLQGGDVVLETKNSIDTSSLWQEAGVIPEETSAQLEINATLSAGIENLAFFVRVVDDSYPLYGSLTLKNQTYRNLNENEIYLDQAGLDRLKVSVGDQVILGAQTFTLVDTVVSEPTSLLGGFNFLPKAIISQQGFAKTELNPAFLNLDYVYAARFAGLTEENNTNIKNAGAKLFPGERLTIAGESRSGLQFGLQLVSDFLIISVLITAALAAVNVYSSTLYLITVEKKSLAVLLSLGVNKRNLAAILGLTLAYTVIIASVVGLILGVLLFLALTNLVGTNFNLDLPNPNFWLNAATTVVLISTIAISSFIPAVRKTLSLKPKQILANNEDDPEGKSNNLRSVFIITGATLTPLVFLASVLLTSLKDGVIAVLIIGGIYIALAIIFTLLLNLIYKKRSHFKFFTKTIISQKKADGLFGIISLTSLFVALTAISTLTLVQVSLGQYLTEELNQTIPTTYIIDVQPSQKDALIQQFPEVELYANVRARIVSIDNVSVQEMINAEADEGSRELTREFNLTSRNELLSSETIAAGVWSAGKVGEVSVDIEYADRVGINLGSKIIFLIQGFEVITTVTSLRETDSRSGLPFFYFVLSPEDLELFPGVFFGYAYYEKETRSELGQYIGQNIPNVSFIETENLGAQLTILISTLMTLVFFVTLPPLVIATLLIATLVVSSYQSRRRDSAKLRALGAKRSSVLIQYLVETISLTLIAAVLAYAVSLGITYIINYSFLELNSIALFDLKLIFSFVTIIFLVGLIGYYLFKSDKAPIRELLSYDQDR